MNNIKGFYEIVYMFSLCIPTMDRFDNFLKVNLPKYIENQFIYEIIISDENGNDVNKIQDFFPNQPKLKLYVNSTRQGPFLNKLIACKYASCEWIALLDSDNFAPYEYFKTANTYIDTHIHNQNNIILAPCMALPNFDYSHLSNIVYTKNNIAHNSVYEKSITHNPNSECLMNTGNYIINKYLINNLNLSNEVNNIQYSSACDVIYFNTLLFEQLDLNLHVVPNMVYYHCVHSGSIYTQTSHMYPAFNQYVHQRYRSLK